MALLGRTDSFDLKTDNITEYIERVEQYFIANDVTDEKKQTAIFLTVIGNETYSLLRNLLAPESPAGKTVKTLSETLIDHLKPQPIIIAERFKFYSRDVTDRIFVHFGLFFTLLPPPNPKNLNLEKRKKAPGDICHHFTHVYHK